MSYSLLPELNSNEIKTVHIRIEGHQPLIFHNSQMANPMNRFSKAIKPFNAKRKKTDEDWINIYHLEFLGSLYYDENIGVYMPAQWFEASLVSAMSKVKRGSKNAVRGGLYVNEPKIPLEYNGPKTPEELWEDENFRRMDIVTIKAASAKIVRCRPCFPAPWAGEFSISVISSVLDVADVADAFIRASKFEGLGDYRPKFGRYNVTKFDVE